MNNRMMRTPPYRRTRMNMVNLVSQVGNLVANAGPNQILVGIVLTLDGSLSTGDILTSTWTQVSGPISLIVSVGSLITLVTGIIPGVYVFQLSLNGGLSVSQVTINVNLF